MKKTDPMPDERKAMEQTPSGSVETARAAGPLWLAYVAPMALFMVFTALIEPNLTGQYVWVYAAKALLVTVALAAFRAPWRDIRFDARALIAGIVAGLALFAMWLLVDKYVPYPRFDFLGKRVGFNPYAAIPDPMLRAFFLVVRFYGLALMVPVMEELFWRSFLLRYVTEPDFTRLPLGAFSWQAFAFVAALFGLAHPEWLAAVLFACACALLLRQTRSLFACIVAHSVTNLALGIYVVVAKDWVYW